MLQPAGLYAEPFSRVPGEVPSASAVVRSASLRLLRSDESGVVLELFTPAYELTTDDLPAGRFDRLEVRGLATDAGPGQPLLPLAGALLGAPPDAQVEIRLLLDEAIPVEGRFNLLPAPRPLPVTDDQSPGQSEYVPDPVVYADATPYPASVARITDDAWLRDRRIVRLALYPFQYNPALGTLIWHRRLQVAVNFGREPVSATFRPTSDPFDPLLRQVLLNYETARAWRSQPKSPVPDTQFLTLHFQSPLYKIVVDRDGLYRLTYTDLQAAGMEVEAVDPRTFSLTSQGQDVAILVHGEEDGCFDPEDYILFYGLKFRGDRLAELYAGEDDHWPTLGLYGWQPRFSAVMLEKYTNENVYWLTAGGASGLRMETVNGAPAGMFPAPDFYTATVHAEQSNHWKTTHFTSEDTWFWDIVQTTSSVTRTYTTTLSGLAAVPFSATVRAEVVALSHSGVISPDHHTRFTLNTWLLEDATWDGLRRHRLEASLPQTALLEGTNSLRFHVSLQPDTTSDEIYFDWFEIEYARRLWAEGNRLLFSDAPGGAREYRVGQLTDAAAQVYDVSHPLQPVQVISPAITGNGSTFTVTFQVTPTGQATYLVVGASAVQPPRRVAQYLPPDLSGANNGADYLIITHQKFYTAVQTLADYRAAQGWRVRVIDIEDLYNQFNYGIWHSVAIKNFLAYAYSYWQAPAPSYVVLVGDGHWNFKGDGIKKYGVPGPIYIPPHLAWVDPWQGEVDSANLLVAVAGQDILPDMYVGRMPVNNLDELAAVISKTLTYEQNGLQDWQRRLLFVADNGPDAAGDFRAMAEDIIAHYTPAQMQIDRIYLNDYCGAPASPPVKCPAVNAAITRTLNQTGTFLANYIGHASLNRWAHEQIFVNKDIATLTNADKWPVVVSMDCLDGYWIHGKDQGLIEELLRAAGKGAVAAFSPTGLGVASGHDVLHRGFYTAFSPTGLGVASGHDVLHRGFYTAIFRDGVRQLGPITLFAKLALYDTQSHHDLIHTFTVFGDPALPLPLYQFELSLPTVEQSGGIGKTISYTLRVTNTGLVTDTLTLTMTGQLWPTRLPATRVTLPAGTGTDVEVQVTVPVTAQVGSTDTVTLTVTSEGDRRWRVARLTTVASANRYDVFLPIVLKLG